MVSCDIITELNHTLLVGAYLPTLTLEHITDFKEALQRFRDPIFLGYLNVNFDEVRISRSQHVLDLLSECGLIDLVRNF